MEPNIEFKNELFGDTCLFILLLLFKNNDTKLL